MKFHLKKSYIKKIMPKFKRIVKKRYVIMTIQYIYNLFILSLLIYYFLITFKYYKNITTHYVYLILSISFY